jgi:hypothetical protein
MSAPLVSHIYTADPSAHVFNGKVYIYPSHDIESPTPFNDNGDHFDMNDYHVLSLTSLSPLSAVTDHGVALSLPSVPWASRQLWAPDAAYNAHADEYLLYFPAKDQNGIFRIGVAASKSPEGPFTPEKECIKGSFSIDPAVFVDPHGDKRAYLYFGGLWGGQLQCYQGSNNDADFDESLLGPKEPKGPDAKALFPKVAVLDRETMREINGAVRDLVILAPETGQPIAADDHDRRFFEAAWMHERKGTYYFSYSTGDTHFLAYATAKSPLGPFTYAGRLLDPVLGWTTHHSVVEFEGRWWLFYHDCEISKGITQLRNVKVREVFYDDEGNMSTKKE